MSNKEMEGEQGEEMQLNKYAAFVSSVKKNKCNMWQSVLILYHTDTNYSCVGNTARLSSDFFKATSRLKPGDVAKTQIFSLILAIKLAARMTEITVDLVKLEWVFTVKTHDMCVVSFVYQFEILCGCQ